MKDRLHRRQEMGEALKKFRTERGLSLYKAARNGGIRMEQVKAVEEGRTNYTMDVLLGYLEGCGVQMHFTANPGSPSERPGGEDKGL